MITHMITNSERISKVIPKDFIFQEHQYNNLEITISYSKNRHCYSVYIVPIYVEGISITMIPHISISQVLLHNVQRRSKGKLQEAINNFNENIDIYRELISKKYKQDFTSEELMFEI